MIQCVDVALLYYIFRTSFPKILVMPLGGVGLICRAMHADLPVYNNRFPYPKLLLKNRLLYCTKSYIQHLPTYLPFFLNKMQFYQ